MTANEVKLQKGLTRHFDGFGGVPLHAGKLLELEGLGGGGLGMGGSRGRMKGKAAAQRE